MQAFGCIRNEHISDKFMSSSTHNAHLNLESHPESELGTACGAIICSHCFAPKCDKNQ